MEITAPIATLLASAISISSGIISGLVVRAYFVPRRRKKIRVAILGEISEMNAIMSRSDFDAAIAQVRTRAWKNFPRVIDPSLPQEPTFKLLQDNLEVFSDREIQLLYEFYRRLKASRAYCAALLDTSNLSDDQVRGLCDAASNEWMRVQSTAEVFTREFKGV